MDDCIATITVVTLGTEGQILLSRKFTSQSSAKWMAFSPWPYSTADLIPVHCKLSSM